jgi:hypothetical protein
VNRDDEVLRAVLYIFGCLALGVTFGAALGTLLAMAFKP